MTKVQIPTHKLADLSTCHIMQTDAARLDDWAMTTAHPRGVAPLTVYSKSEYGWYVVIPPAAEFDDRVATLREEGASIAFIALLRMLSEEEFMILCLDRDGEIVDGLTQFNW